jgi:hypothetical protein
LLGWPAEHLELNLWYLKERAGYPQPKTACSRSRQTASIAPVPNSIDHQQIADGSTPLGENE